MSTFTATINGEEKTLKVNKPNAKQNGQQVYNKAFRNALDSGALLAIKLDDFMREQGVWDEAKQKQLIDLQTKLDGLELKLKEGGIKKSEGREIALEIVDLRDSIKRLTEPRIALTAMTAEGQADDARFNYWVSVCTVYNDTGLPVFKDVDDYIAKSTEQYAVTAANKLASILYGISEDYSSSLEELKFLKEFGYCDNEYRLVDKDGNYVDKNGRLVDKDGYYLDEQGNRVDKNGRRLDENGEVIIERKPFLDD